jgi:hypothetical protein
MMVTLAPQAMRALSAPAWAERRLIAMTEISAQMILVI